jgi:YhcH/YjgK/YiaL family protein
MITGSLQQTEVRRFLSQVPAFARAFQWIARCPADHPDGIVQLEGADLYVNVHGYDTRRREDCCWESHRRTADIQLCLTGGELIDWSPVAPAGAGSYQTDRDFEAWPGDIAPAETIALGSGRFAIFLPGELHRPVIANGRDRSIRKLVVKIAAHLLS